MQRVISDEERWLALFLRHVCKAHFRVRTMALSGSSINTIEKRMRMEAAHTGEEIDWFKRDIDHKQLMLKIGMRLGLGAREMML